jgi:hypothetical protein
VAIAREAGDRIVGIGGEATAIACLVTLTTRLIETRGPTPCTTTREAGLTTACSWSFEIPCLWRR